MTRHHLDYDKLECIANKLKAIGHPIRLAIIELLDKNIKGLTVTEIQKNINIEQASTSNHLKILKDQQILISIRDGKKRYYSLKHDKLIDFIDSVDKCD